MKTKYHTYSKQGFGPGSLESVTLHTRRIVGSTGRQARLTGTYTVYCGNGNEHTVDVSTLWGYTNLPTQPTEDEAEAFVREDIDFHLDLEWYDPCEATEQED